jgi:lysylphosphatidylglycerol synthetase-like protein (DUF2156 family)
LGDGVWYADQFIRHPAAPLGTIERCIDAAFRAVRDTGIDSATLGLMPLARVDIENVPAISYNNNFTRLLKFGALCGRHWYNAHGLTRFKQKFLPHHISPIFFCSHRSLSAIPLALGLIETFCGKAWYNGMRFLA